MVAEVGLRADRECTALYVFLKRLVPIKNKPGSFCQSSQKLGYLFCTGGLLSYARCADLRTNRFPAAHFDAQTVHFAATFAIFR